MNNSKKYLLVMGLALGLPSSVLGVALFVKYLIDEKIVSNSVGLIIIILVIVNIFYLIVRSVTKQKN